MSELRATVLTDNISRNGLESEWGFSVFIEYKSKNILLDTGSTGVFAKNANTLNIDLKKVNYGVLSHAHYDHSDGMETFFKVNKTAKFHIRSGTAENCYSKRRIFAKYIGIKKGTLKKYADRITYVSGDYELCGGVYLIPHKTEHLELKGRRAGMLRKEARRKTDDDFSHEQSLVFDTAKGLVIFNSCSHGGADNIINEVAATFPDKNIFAIIGGFHLYREIEQAILSLADGIKKTGIKRVVTGHCTGDKGFEVLKQELGNSIEQTYSGYVFEV